MYVCDQRVQPGGQDWTRLHSFGPGHWLLQLQRPHCDSNDTTKSKNRVYPWEWSLNWNKCPGLGKFEGPSSWQESHCFSRLNETHWETEAECQGQPDFAVGCAKVAWICAGFGVCWATECMLYASQQQSSATVLFRWDWTTRWPTFERVLLPWHVENLAKDHAFTALRVSEFRNTQKGQVLEESIRVA